MYFIRVSWKYMANVELEAEGGGGCEGCEGRAGACRPTSDPGPHLLNSTSHLWAYFLFVQHHCFKNLDYSV